MLYRVLHSIVALCALCTLLALQPDAAAQTGAELKEAAARVQRGIELFDQGKHAESLRELTAAYRVTGSWKVLIHIGIAQRTLGRYQAAHRSLKRYLREGGKGVSPALRARAAAELRRIRPLLAELTVVVRGGPAAVKVDGERIGRAPLSRALLLGPRKHTVSVDGRRFEPLRREVDLVSGAKRRLVLALVARRSVLRVQSRPEGAAVRLDGRAVGKTPWEARLPWGEHRVRVERAGYRPGKSRVLLEGPQPRELTIALVALPPPPPPPWYKRWYWWAAIGAGVAAAVVTTAIVATRPRYDYTFDYDRNK